VTSRKTAILLVDDDPSVLAPLEEGLRDYGFSVWVAADGQQALDAYRRHQKDIALVLMNIRMPSLDGPRLVTGLRRLNPQIRCCFMSGHIGHDTEIAANTRVLTKPFGLSEIVRILRQILGIPIPQEPVEC
jgi:CheY-like chemotaxis protein